MRVKRISEKLKVRNELVRECLAEFFGTFLLMVFGNGVVAQFTLSREEEGSILGINLAWGTTVAIAVYVSGNVSGGHINPAVTFTFCVLGRVPWYKFPFYVCSQVFGAFMSGPVVLGVYNDAFNAFDGGIRQVYGENASAGIFTTFPKPHLSMFGGFVDQITGTALLLCCVLALIDARNNKPPTGLEPLLIGLLVFTIGPAYGYNCGYPINPARDFGPRLFVAMAGWGTDVFFAENGMHWWIVPIIGPLVGGVLGAMFYLLLIELHWPELVPDTYPEKSTVSNRNSKEIENGEIYDTKNV